MGLPATHGNQSQAFVTPAQAGAHLDSRFRGNDVTFVRAEPGIWVQFVRGNAQSKIPRFARNDIGREIC